MKSGILLKLKNLIVLLVLVLFSNQLVAQNNGGIFFQAVARDNYSNPAKNRKIYIQSSIVQSSINGTKVLIEEHQANTDASGMFSISIGNGTRVGGAATGLSSIDWSNGPFYLNLKVAITPLSGVSGWDYTKEWIDMGTTSFGAVPYALYASNAAGVNQKLSLTDTTKMLSVYAKAQAVQSLATTVNTKLSFSDTASMLNPYIKASLVLDSAFINTELKSKADTADVNTALNLKANTADVTTALALKANTTDVNTSLATKVDKVTGKDLSTNDYTTAEKTKLAAITGTNTGDQDLSALATNTALALKANTADVNTALNLKANTADVNNSLNLKANTADVTTALATKVDKVTGKDLSTNDYTTAEKTKLAAITGTNTGDQDLSALATTANVTTALALKANTTDVNTALNLKANTSDVTTSLATKVDKVTGKDLSTNDYTTAEKTKLAAITGTNTGDQTDITGNAATASKLAIAKKINGVAFDGSADISVTANAGTLTGTTLASNVVNSSLTSVGTLTSGTISLTTNIVTSGTITAAGMGLGVSTPNASAVLDVNSTSQGFLPPRMTTEQRNAITAAEGLTIWNTDNKQLEVYDGSYWKNMLGLLVSPLKVGDSYGGGKVFYIFNTNDVGFIQGQTHGLIAATEDQTTDAGVKWFPDKYYGATGTYIGLGLPNTLSIILSAVLTGTTNMSSFAAGLANSYRDEGGHMDWYLPSKDELNLLYKNKDAVGGFATSGIPGYWSSTQKGSLNFTKFEDFAKGVTNARIQFFYTGGSPVQQKGTITDTGIENLRRVRAIRIF
jgi:hypothetical protein